MLPFRPLFQMSRRSRAASGIGSALSKRIDTPVPQALRVDRLAVDLVALLADQHRRAALESGIQLEPKLDLEDLVEPQAELLDHDGPRCNMRNATFLPAAVGIEDSGRAAVGPHHLRRREQLQVGQALGRP